MTRVVALFEALVSSLLNGYEPPNKVDTTGGRIAMRLLRNTEPRRWVMFVSIQT